jgi:hypothetical protein
VSAGAIAIAIFLGLATVGSLHKGEAPPITWVSEVAGTASVGACERSGPVSGQGFGYWWTCEVTVRLDDGRTVRVAIDHSVVSPADRGQPVPIVERCSNRPGEAPCRYSRPGGEILGLGVRLLRMVSYFVAVIGLLTALILLLRAVLGRRAYARLLRQGPSR